MAINNNDGTSILNKLITSDFVKTSVAMVVCLIGFAYQASDAKNEIKLSIIQLENKLEIRERELHNRIEKLEIKQQRDINDIEKYFMRKVK